jgi:hypothetical protein
MQFTTAINFAYEPPEGWKKKVTLAQYAKLGDKQKYYEPLYAKYRTKKIRDYDIDTGQFVGWRPIQVGIGDPTSYKYVGYFEARMIDQINSSNVLMDRVLNKPIKWSKQ